MHTNSQIGRFEDHWFRTELTQGRDVDTANWASPTSPRQAATSNRMVGVRRTPP